MKKRFSLQPAGQDASAARVVERVRNEVGKYINREKRKALPAEHDQWLFACRVGDSAETALSEELKSVPAAIDRVAATGAPEVYVEIIASARPRPKPPVTAPTEL